MTLTKKVADLVDEGKINISCAEALAKLPLKEQDQFICDARIASRFINMIEAYKGSLEKTPERLIIDTVTRLQGCKTMELVARGEIVEACGNDLHKIIDELITTGSLVEIEYTLPQMNHRVKSFLLPAGTKITIK